MQYQIQAPTHPTIVGAITTHAELAASAEIDAFAGHAARRVLDVLGVLTVDAVDARDRDGFLPVRQVLDITKRLQHQAGVSGCQYSETGCQYSETGRQYSETGCQYNDAGCQYREAA